MTPQKPLAELQRWFLSKVTEPDGVAAVADEQSIRATIFPSRQQTAVQRLAVYRQAYCARLLEVLRELFPCLRFAVGDELFDRFALEYLQAHPPAGYTLHTLADKFADYLQATRPADGDDWAGFVVDLARLEHAIDQVFDGPGPESHSPLHGVEPEAATCGCASTEPADVRLALVPGFRLLAFDWPVSAYFTAWKAGRNPAWPSRQPQHIALLRRDYIVRRHELSRAQFDLLAELAAGQTLEAALAAVACSVTPAQVQGWFTHWSAEGFFAGLTSDQATLVPGPAGRRPGDTGPSE
jgi:hypothetical protein